ncbi:PAS domain-containing sensor histidine kinase [Halorientalis pallida]|uniref:sensor histidine kinase n=1 Tax=Halorientalis pallida TaxID=2479928 RepID=UPI003C704C8B
MYTVRADGPRPNIAPPEDVLDTLDEVYYYLSPDGQLRQWNERLSEVTGYSDAEIAEKSAMEFFGPDDAETIADAIGTVVSEQRQVIVEADYRTKDGEFVPYEFSGKPVVEDGEVTGVIGIGREITERRQRQRRLETITDNIPIVLFAIDGDGEIVLSRGKGLATLGLEPDAVVGESAFDVYADNPALLADIERALGGEAFRSTVDVDGAVFETWYQPITERGEVTRVVGVARDITANKNYENRLERQRDGLKLLNRMVRHDIRNDLQLILLHLERLETNVEPAHGDRVGTAIESTQNAIALTRTARDLADVMLQSESSLERVDLAEAVETPLADVRASYPEATLAIEGTLPNTAVLADDMLHSVVRNLLTNAVQHNDTDAPTVTASATETDEEVVLRVADDGPGIPDGRKDEVFARGEKGLESEGTGIGLYLVRELVDRYGAQVAIEDNDPEGTVFSVTLRRAD